MSEEETLTRVRVEVAAGDVSMARQRLRGLVGTYPQRLDLREQLAELYRRDGHAAQAGRWSYLSLHPDPGEIHAFERAYRDPVARMRALGWRGAEDAVGAVVAERLATVRKEAERVSGHPLSWGRPASYDHETSWADRVFAGFLVLVVGLIVLGGIAFLVEGVRTVAGWVA